MGQISLVQRNSDAEGVPHHWALAARRGHESEISLADAAFDEPLSRLPFFYLTILPMSSFPPHELSHEWITIATLTDPMEADMLEDLFQHEGIPVAMAGKQHRAMLGVLGGYVSILMQVPANESERALELLNAFRAAPPPEKDATNRAESHAAKPRSPKAAAGVAMLGVAVLASVGAGHVYVRQYVAAASLFVLGWTAMIALLRGDETWPAIPLLVLIDMIGAATAAAMQTRGEVVRTNRHGFAIVVVALTAFALSPMIAGFLSYHFEAPTPRIQRDHSPDWDGRTR